MILLTIFNNRFNKLNLGESLLLWCSKIDPPFDRKFLHWTRLRRLWSRIRHLHHGGCSEIKGEGGDDRSRSKGADGEPKTIGTARTHLVLIIANDLIVEIGSLQRARDVGVLQFFIICRAFLLSCVTRSVQGESLHCRFCHLYFFLSESKI